jgi:outer membrane protein assembly factor BamB
LVPQWKVPVGLGYSSPIILNGMLYLSDLVVEKAIVHERVVCFNPRSGKQLWNTQHDATPPDWFFNPEQMRGPGSTPIIYDGRVYAISMFFELTCLDARTGAVVWTRDLVKDYQLPPSSLDASPLVDGNLLIVSIGGRPGAGVVAFDLLTGREVWRALAEAACYSLESRSVRGRR